MISNAWQTAVTVLQEAMPPDVAAGSHAMTIAIEYPPETPAPRRTATADRRSASPGGRDAL